MTDDRRHTQNLMAFEMEALSLLLLFWANPKVDEGRADYLIKKIPKIREGIAVGIGPGGHENYTPRELVYSEYKIIKESLDKLKKEYTIEDIPDLYNQMVDQSLSFDCQIEKNNIIFKKPIKW